MSIIIRCCDCGKEPHEIQEYIDGAEEYETTAVQHVLADEGTFNPMTLRFCCTDCYIKRGMPVRQNGGWKAPFGKFDLAENLSRRIDEVDIGVGEND